MFEKLFYAAVNDWGENVFYPTTLGYVCLIVFFILLIVLALILGGKSFKNGNMTRAKHTLRRDRSPATSPWAMRAITPLALSPATQAIRQNSNTMPRQSI